jgi:hypothetical protein
MKLSNLLVEILRAWVGLQSDPEYTMGLMSLLEVNTHVTRYIYIYIYIYTSFVTFFIFHNCRNMGMLSLEESLSISTSLATRPSRLAPKKCINKSIWLATGGGTFHGYTTGTFRVPTKLICICIFPPTSRDGLG